MYDDNKEVLAQPSYMHEMVEATMKHREQVYQQQEDARLRKELSDRRALQELFDARNEYVNEYYNDSYKRSQFFETLKASMLSECMLKLYKESCVGPMTNRDKAIATNLINGFIKEAGVDNLLRNFRTKNKVLSEFNRICTKYYERVLEEVDESPEVKMDPTIGIEFYDDLADIDSSEAAEMIRDKVADALTDFADSNMDAKLEYEELLRNAKDQAAIAKTEESAKEILETAQREITEADANRYKSVFHYMVESLAKKCFKDETLKSKYITEGKLDMDLVVNDVQLIYTMLEMANTTNMVDVDENFIKQYLKAM